MYSYKILIAIATDDIKCGESLCLDMSFDEQKEQSVFMPIIMSQQMYIDKIVEQYMQKEISKQITLNHIAYHCGLFISNTYITTTEQFVDYIKNNYKTFDIETIADWINELEIRLNHISDASSSGKSISFSE